MLVLQLEILQQSHTFSVLLVVSWDSLKFVLIVLGYEGTHISKTAYPLFGFDV
jgi:hypothetical protein